MVAWARLPATSLMLVLGEAEQRERFAYALQQALAARSMSERQLAMQLEVDPRRIASWRKAKSLPTYYETLALAKILSVSEELFRNPPPVPEPAYYPIQDYLTGAVDRGLAQGLSDGNPDDEGDDEPDEQRPRPRR
jgi:transcriptional regulator with XRE-family HTH domain